MTNKKIYLSVVITAFNEEKKIAECIESVKFANEIILVNSSSTDKTVEIAKKAKAKVFTKPNNPMLNVNKNFGFTKAEGEWILNIDSDERVTPELADEIKEIVHSNSEINGYYIPRKNIIFGKWIRHAGWYPDYQLRLFRKGKGKFAEEHVHEMLAIEGKTGHLINPLMHLNYESISQFISKTSSIYAPNEADQLIKKGYKINWKDSLSMPLKEFLSRFFAREGYKDGFHGLMLSLLMSFYHLIVFANIWEKEKFLEFNEINFLAETEKETKKGYKELAYWVYNEKIKNTKNILTKTTLRIGRVFNR